MSILIKGIEMPKEGWYLDLVITSDGVVRFYGDEEEVQIAEAVELPDHGDLIERDSVLASFKESLESCKEWRKEIAEDREDYAEMMARIDNTAATFVECSIRLKKAPVVIPAERSGDGET